MLREHAHASTVFADVATLIDVMVDEGLTCQTNLAAKAGATHTGQFIGSFEFYRELRRTRYGRIPDHPAGAIAMDVFIAVDEVLHEVLHLLFLANELRAGIVPRSTLLAEELSLTWWQAVVHNRVFPEWLADRHILEINDDFMLSAENQESRRFWKTGTVFDQYAGYPWVPHVLARLPARASYIGQRPDLARGDRVVRIPARGRVSAAGRRRAPGDPGRLRRVPAGPTDPPFVIGRTRRRGREASARLSLTVSPHRGARDRIVGCAGGRVVAATGGGGALAGAAHPPPARSLPDRRCSRSLRRCSGCGRRPC